MSVTAAQSAMNRPDLDQMFGLFSHRYRRWLIFYMVKFDKQTIPVTTAVNLVTHLDPTISREAAYQILIHSHLRRLDLAGVIDFDRGGERITFREHPLIEQLARDAMEWDAVFGASD
jgi:hypothetical protein